MNAYVQECLDFGMDPVMWGQEAVFLFRYCWLYVPSDGDWPGCRSMRIAFRHDGARLLLKTDFDWGFVT